MFQPTDEQVAALDAFRTGENVSLNAFAGTGKTSTLKLMARNAPTRRGLYFAFNKKIADEAKREFPQSVLCSTLHSLAYRGIMDAARKARMNGPRQNGYAVARILGINGPYRINDKQVLAQQQQARLVMETVTKFCQTDAEQPNWTHTPFLPGIENKAERRALSNYLVPFARKAWADLTNPNGALKYGHDHYLKEWALTHPQLGADYVLVDEAQDSNSLTVGLVRDQRNAQVITVGDTQQSIYGWRGAVDAMDAFDAKHRLLLTQSFRFGESVAAEANKWLELLGSEARIMGTPTIPSTLAPLGRDGSPVPDAILCRTNAEAVTRVMDLQQRSIPVALLGGGTQMEQFARAAADLMSTGQSWHADLAAFTSWGQVQDYAENDHGGSDLAVMVKVIDQYGHAAVIDAMQNLANDRAAQVVVSTAHKSKGAEWNKVQIAGDFQEPKPDENGDTKPSREESMLAYVAVTRAKVTLDRGSLEWVDRVLAEHRGGVPVQGQPQPRPVAAPAPAPAATLSAEDREYLRQYVADAEAAADDRPMSQRIIDARRATEAAKPKVTSEWANDPLGVMSF